jgi:hypothetical protein
MAEAFCQDCTREQRKYCERSSQRAGNIRIKKSEHARGKKFSPHGSNRGGERQGCDYHRGVLAVDDEIECQMEESERKMARDGEAREHGGEDI